MLNVELVAIGTELLLGQLLDTNSFYVAGALAEHGVDVYQKHTVGDNAVRLAALLRGALERADGAITTGGLGPTVDDVTKEAVAAAVGTTLELHEPSLRAVEARLRAFGRTGPIGENNRRQAILPKGAVVLENPHGTAPGFVALRGDGKFVACMPGVPREMKPMLAEQLMPWLTARYDLREAIFTRTLHTVGISEAEVDRRIEPLFRTLENPKIAVLAHDYRVDVKLMAKAPDPVRAETLIAPRERELRDLIGAEIFGIDDETLEGAIVHALVERGLSVATAESITGGGIADAFVSVPGASAAFRGGLVAYADEAKRDLLGIDPELLQCHGAVSEEVAREMAAGARERFRADLALASTGIAGPTGATDEKPVGLVYLALAVNDGIEARRFTFPGRRADVRRRSIVAALNLLWRRLGQMQRVSAAPTHEVSAASS